MTTAQAIIARAATFGIKTTLWEGAGRTRIYAQTDRRDMSVYLECDGTPADIEGAAFKVICKTEQHPNWVQSQVAHHRKKLMPLFWAYVLERYAHVGPQPNAFGPDINAMIDDARAFEAAQEALMEEAEAD